MSKSNFENQIKQSVERFDDLPSGQVWDNLDQKLNQNLVMKNANNQWLKILSLAAAGALLIMAGYFFLQTETENNEPDKTENQVLSETNSADITIMKKYFKEELEEAKFNQKGLAIYICMENCVFCERFQNETLNQPQIKTLFGNNFDQIIVDLKSKEYLPFLKQFDIKAAPSMFFFKNDGTFIDKVVGFRSSKDFEGFLNAILEMSENLEPTEVVNISQETFPTEINVFPNPSNGSFAVQIKSDPLTTHIRLIDMNGKELLSEELKIMDGLYEQEFDLSNHPKGTYIFHCYQKGNLLTEQIIVQ